MIGHGMFAAMLACWLCLGCQERASRGPADSGSAGAQASGAGKLAPQPDTAADMSAADSIVLERGGCAPLGGCPAYRLRITRAGAVLIQARTLGVPGRVDTATHTATVSASSVRDLWEYAAFIGFGQLPDTIQNVPAYCAEAFDDGRSITTSVFVGTWSKRVADYDGCVWGPAGLRDFQTRIDSVTRSSRWLRSISARPPNER